MSKCFKVCGTLAFFLLWACSSDESSTSVNAEQEDASLSQDTDSTLSSSSNSIDSGNSITESSERPSTEDKELSQSGQNELNFSSSATVANENKSFFLPIEVQVFQENKNGEFYLLQLLKYSNYNFLSDSVYSFESETISYDENGRETLHDTTNNSVNGGKTSSNGVSHYYKYVDEAQVNYQNVFSETETINDLEINWVVYYHNKYKTITDENQIESEIVQTTTKELTNISNDGKEYILRTTQDGKANTSYIKLILDASGFKTKTITYDSNNSFLSGNAFLKMPNAPESLSKVSVCYQPFFEGTSPYEYYNVSCKDVVNTSETYQLVVESSSKMKNYDNVTRLKYIYTYNRFEY